MVRGKLSGFGVALLAAVLLVLPGAGLSNAATVLIFDQEDSAPQDGTISWGGGTDPLIGSGIDFSFISLKIDGVGAGTLNCSALTCMELEFNTGALSGNGADLEWDQGAGWFVRVVAVGDDPFAALTPGDISDGDILLEGTALTSAFVNGSVVGLEGYDVKNQFILDFFGLDGTAFTYVSTNIKTNLTGDNSTGFTADVTQADITNTAPGPGVGWLLVIGLSAVVASRRRQS